MKQINIGIKGIGSISPLGDHAHSFQAYQDKNHYFSTVHNEWGGQIHQDFQHKIDELRATDKRFKKLDKSTLLGMLAAKDAIANTSWKQGNFGVILGSSRGAAETLENSHKTYLNEGHCPTTTSPLTTMGNLSHWAGEYIGAGDARLSHSVTCSSSFHALLTALSWIEAGWQDQFIVGGVEAPLTAFFIEQMKALRIYAQPSNEKYPNQSLASAKKHNTMILGEGACVIAIEKAQAKENYLAKITGIGFGTEALTHHTSVSDRGENIYKAMKMATQYHSLADIDTVVMHAPGTILGDQSELNAVSDLFAENKPQITSNKWKIGHTLGASGMLSLEMALIMLQQANIISPPFVSSPHQIKPQRILVNAMGFGGNAVSVLIEK